MQPDRIASYQAPFAAGLLAPDVAAPAHVAGLNGRTAGKRYDIYRNNVTSSLVDALAAVYPAVQRITGIEFFRAMARFHVRETPPVSPLLFECGRDFPDFIQRYEYAQDMPWLADVARIERAWLDAYHAYDAEPLAADALAAVPADRLGDVTFVPHPAACILRSDHPAVSIFAMNRGDGPVEAITSIEPEDALITRLECDVVVRKLPPGAAVFLSCLFAGETLATAAGAAITATPAFDLSTAIAGMIEAGVFTEIAWEN